MKLRIILLVVGVVTLFVLNIFFGSVHIDAADVLQTLLHGGASNEAVAYIILGSRLPTAMTAMLAGAGLATAGLLLQTSSVLPSISSVLIPSQCYEGLPQ